MEQKKTTGHSLTLCDREKLTLTGVTDVDAFNEEEITVITDFGELTVKGELLHVEALDSFEPAGPFGAKSIGECSVVPTLSAIGNAVANALDCEMNSLPMTKEKVLAALRSDRKTQD